MAAERKESISSETEKPAQIPAAEGDLQPWQREAALGAGTALHNPELPLTTLPLCPFPEMFKSQNGDKGAALPAQLLGVSSCCWGLSLAADTRNSLHQVTESTGALFWSLLCKINQLCSDKQL